MTLWHAKLILVFLQAHIIGGNPDNLGHLEASRALLDGIWRRSGECLIRSGISSL